MCPPVSAAGTSLPDPGLSPGDAQVWGFEKPEGDLRNQHDYSRETWESTWCSQRAPDSACQDSLVRLSGPHFGKGRQPWQKWAPPQVHFE